MRRSTGILSPLFERFLESRGIRVPIFGGSLGEKVQSGVAKIAGKTEHADRELRKAV